jgi:aspartate/tyrosine/aromatic aminotransferase
MFLFFVQGLESFLQATSSIILGKDSPSLKEERVAVMQTLSGTGALRIAAEFIAKFSDAKPKVYISDPSWGNHHTIFQKAGLETTKYRLPPPLPP